ncbi:hypothetical protein RQP46_005064 [Phenoliferia psychrophenolica]
MSDPTEKSEGAIRESFLNSGETGGDKAAVPLAPWARQWGPLVGLTVALILQTGLLAASVFIWLYPISRPIGQTHLFGGVTVKGFNVSFLSFRECDTN